MYFILLQQIHKYIVAGHKLVERQNTATFPVVPDSQELN